jgi:tyrosine-protein kinase Etk/Wzc
MSTSTYGRAPSSSSPDDEFVLSDLIAMIRDEIVWVVGIAAAIIALGVLYAVVATPIYSADALVQVEQPGPAVLGLTPNAQTGAATGAPPTNGEIELMRSRAVIEPVVTQYKLNFSVVPHTVPFLGKFAALFATPGRPAPAWFWMDSDAWGGEVIDVAQIDVPTAYEGQKLTLRALPSGGFALFSPKGEQLLEGTAGQVASANGFTLMIDKFAARPGTEFTVTRANDLAVQAGFASGLTIAEKGKETGIVQIQLDGADPVTTAAILNSVLSSYITQHLAHRQEETTKMLTFLNSEAPKLRDDLQKAEAALAEYQERVGSMQPTAESQTYLQGGLDYGRQIAMLQLQRTQLLQSFTPASPEVRLVDAQLAQLNGQKSQFDARFSRLPVSEQNSVSLQRNVKVAEDVYTALLSKTNELSLEKAGVVGNVRVVDEALVPDSPVRPKRGLIISASVLLGLIAGVLFAYLRRSFFSGIEDPAYIERSLHLPMLGTVTFSPEQGRRDALLSPATASTALGGRLLEALHLQKPGMAPAAARTSGSNSTALATLRGPLLAQGYPHDLAVESLRSIRTALQFGLADAPNNVVAITGPAPSIGKSFLSANLAALFAETGKKVLLIDADLRRGNLGQYFDKLPRTPGLAEVLSGQLDPQKACLPTEVNGLSVICTGGHPPNPSEMLMSNRFRQLLEGYGAQFDLVVVDTPPMLAVTDASIVANLAGMTVMVVRSGRHSSHEMTASLNKLERAGARVIGAVFNAVNPRRNGRYAGEYTYSNLYTREEDAI